MNQPDKTFQQNYPRVETEIAVSKDGRYIIHRTIITDIKPARYWSKVVENAQYKEKAVMTAAQQLTQQQQGFQSADTLKVEEEKIGDQDGTQ